MAPKHRIIIDTDPGVDDVLAMLLAFSAKPEELEVLMISVTFGNVDVQNCLRNVITVFHQIELEMQWRNRNGMEEGFETLKYRKPLVAVGAEGPLADHQMMADYFHGTDGLGGIHTSHPHLSPTETWNSLFSPSLNTSDPSTIASVQAMQVATPLFEPSNKPAHEEILRLLRENDPGTITILVLGPSTNVATAAATDPEAFLRVKEVVLMGGAIKEQGNITPVAEFNIFADSVAAARLFALTSPNPRSTFPPPHGAPAAAKLDLPPYPAPLPKPLRLVLFPLDITVRHTLHPSAFHTFVRRHRDAGSPLAEWIDAFLSATYAKLAALYTGSPAAPAGSAAGPPASPAPPGLSLHDPLCVWYLLAQSTPAPLALSAAPEDIRVETTGQWTRGACVVDRRNRVREADSAPAQAAADAGIQGSLDVLPEVPGDSGNWLRRDAGNRVWRCVESEWCDGFGVEMLKRVFA